MVAKKFTTLHYPMVSRNKIYFIWNHLLEFFVNGFVLETVLTRIRKKGTGGLDQTKPKLASVQLSKKLFVVTILNYQGRAKMTEKCSSCSPCCQILFENSQTSLIGDRYFDGLAVVTSPALALLLKQKGPLVAS